MAKYTLDTEFNGYKGSLISMAIVCKEDGRSIYLGSKHHLTSNNKIVEWVKDNVMTVINEGYIPIKWCTPVELSQEIENFFKDDPTPNIVVDWPDDIKYFCEAIITGPGTMINVSTITFKVVRIDAYPNNHLDLIQHNAWCDAVALMRKLEDLEYIF